MKKFLLLSVALLGLSFATVSMMTPTYGVLSRMLLNV